jgi:hypothetical protein
LLESSEKEKVKSSGSRRPRHMRVRSTASSVLIAEKAEEPVEKISRPEPKNPSADSNLVLIESAERRANASSLSSRDAR